MSGDHCWFVLETGAQEKLNESVVCLDFYIPPSELSKNNLEVWVWDR